MNTVLGILVAVAFVICGTLFSVGYKTASIWVLFVGLVICCFWLCFFLQQKVSKESKLEQPTFSEEVETFDFSLGEGGISVGYKISELKKTPKEPYNFKGYKPVYLYVANGRLYADVTIYGGSGLAAITIKRNKLSNKPENWDFNSNKNALEVVNENNVPIYQFFYKTPSHIVVNGIFPFPGGLILANESGAVMNPILPTNFKLKRIFKYPSWKYPGEYEETTANR